MEAPTAQPQGLLGDLPVRKHCAGRSNIRAAHSGELVGGASQALTALRAPRWMKHYGKQAELDQLMRQWCEAILRHSEFRQQMDPLTGEFTQPDPADIRRRAGFLVVCGGAGKKPAA